MAVRKRRHGYLSAWLLLMVVINAVTAYSYLFRSADIMAAFPEDSSWVSPVFGSLSVFNVVCAIALFMWKKWAFWAFLSSSVVALVANATLDLGTGPTFSGLVGVAVLYGVLLIGKPDNGWSKLD